MSLLKDIATLGQLPALLRLKKGMTPRPEDVKDCFGARVEANAANLGTQSAIVCEGKELNWIEFNGLSNQYANVFKAQGLGRGDTVCIMMENRIEFLALLIGLNKLGVTAGLLNTNLTGRSLKHCISVIEAKKCIYGAEVIAAIAEVQGELELATGADFLFVSDPSCEDISCPEWSLDLDTLQQAAEAINPPETGDNTIGQTALYIYTSGTTGLPKAAVMSNRRYLISADMSGAAGLKTKPGHRIYLCLPLYHATGLLLGVGSSLTTGASMFVRRKFSASAFRSDICDNNCTHMVYIGELCRYLTNIPGEAGDAQIPLHSIMGNGMRPDIWMGFKERYGIQRICEIYGASEGNVAFANLMNKDLTVGMTSAEVVLVQYDVDQDEIIRDNQGRCIEVRKGDAGLLLGKITPDTVFEGYTDPQATEGKILRNAFSDGDAWFNTGDLMRVVDVGFTLGYDHYQFVDRVGDTFRWKSENVSTNEVGEIINGFDQVKFCNVYGVEIPGADGRAGMASITLNDNVTSLDLEEFSSFVRVALPSYA
ncbi:MAG: AMP-binding protein, partial [Pseudomonadota bacterium]|nr:AMP-binding protein [Pseudomonadota bacterium]